jgi:hypothetical protein
MTFPSRKKILLDQSFGIQKKNKSTKEKSFLTGILNRGQLSKPKTTVRKVKTGKPANLGNNSSRFNDDQERTSILRRDEKMWARSDLLRVDEMPQKLLMRGFWAMAKERKKPEPEPGPDHQRPDDEDESDEWDSGKDPKS